MNTIGTRPNSISRIYYIEEINREVNKIHFYNDNGIIASTRSGWLSCNPKFIDTSISDINYLNITKELKTFKANYNVEKATQTKCHFTINNTKRNSYDDPSCDLYLYVSDENDTEADFKFVSSTPYKELISHSTM